MCLRGFEGKEEDSHRKGAGIKASRDAPTGVIHRAQSRSGLPNRDGQGGRAQSCLGKYLKPLQRHSYTCKQAHNHTMTTLGSVCYRTEGCHIRSITRAAQWQPRVTGVRALTGTAKMSEIGADGTAAITVSVRADLLRFLYFLRGLPEDAGRAASAEEQQCSAWG